jgi:hypothetical protein
MKNVSPKSELKLKAFNPTSEVRGSKQSVCNKALVEDILHQQPSDHYSSNH